MLAMDFEPLLRSAIIESLFDAKAHVGLRQCRHGYVGSPLRLGTRPELTLLRLVTASGPRRH
jgi:hypothetical protein